MKIGYACIPLGVNYTTNRRFILKNFTQAKFIETTKANLIDLLKILEYNVNNRIKLFRISSDIIPFGSHDINKVPWQLIFKEELYEVEKYIKRNTIRVSMHPGQYTVLNSINPETVKKSIADIEYHCAFLDSLNVDYSSKIILHIGGVYSSKTDSMNRFISNFKLLSDSAKKRLAIENDEKSYNITDVLNISKSLHIPVIFDILHHELNPSFSTNLSDILHEVSKTWGNLDGPMKLHYSNIAQNKKAGAHSDFINSTKFINFFNKVADFKPDIMLEVKDKDLSAIKCINCINSNNVNIHEIWLKYKYVILEKSKSIYDKCNEVLLDNNLIELYRLIDMALSLPINYTHQANVLKEIIYDLSDRVLLKEKEQLLYLIKNNDTVKSKKLLHKLSIKYSLEALKNSYFFVY